MSLLLLQLFLLQILASSTQGEFWRRDEELERLSSDIQCDFPVIDGTAFTSFEEIPYIDIPFILTNLTQGWKAYQNWEKASLLLNYGSRNIRSGSEASIVYSGGNAEFPSSLASFLLSFRERNEKNSSSMIQDQFLFDTTILHAIPELKADFSVPSLFQDWDNFVREEKREIWHMLSLGPTRSGLLFHNHGRTWIAVIHGMKGWFLYPPGYNSPSEIEESFPLILSASQWFEQVYPEIKHFPKPFHETDQSMNGFAPFECIQRPGDILYLPDLWNHMTLNIGETIGIGAQEAISSEDRYDIAREGLKLNPRNYEALKDIGLSIYSRQLQELDSFRRSISMLSNHIIFLPDQQAFRDFRTFTEDPMIVIHFLNNSHSTVYQQLFDQLSSLQHTTDVDVIMIPFHNPFAICILSFELELQCNCPLYQLEIYQSTEVINTNSQSNLRAIDDQSIRFESQLIRCLSLDNINVFPTEETLFHSYPFLHPRLTRSATGTIHRLTVHSQVIIQEALGYLRQALEIRPSHPEALQLFSEIALAIGRTEEVKDLLIKAEVGYDERLTTQPKEANDVSNRTIASLYYKLALLSDQMRDDDHTLTLLQKTLRIDGELLLAWHRYYRLLQKRNENTMILDSFHHQLLPILHRNYRQVIISSHLNSDRYSISEILQLLETIFEDMF